MRRYSVAKEELDAESTVRLPQESQVEMVSINCAYCLDLSEAVSQQLRVGVLLLIVVALLAELANCAW
jgi:hypothetical protein